MAERILRECPGIGPAIEELKICDRVWAGADSWRRTGIVTFDANK